jgi:hypothetical protein
MVKGGMVQGQEFLPDILTPYVLEAYSGGPHLLTAICIWNFGFTKRKMSF